MSQLPAFHEIRFPTDLALGASGGPVRRTEIVTLGSGREQRNARWKNSRRQYNAGYGIKTLHDLHIVINFFEERRGRLFGFRFRDPLDWKSCPPGQQVSSSDQTIGVGDGVQNTFQLLKHYGSTQTGYSRKICKPVEGSVLIEINGLSLDPSKFHADLTTGEVSIESGEVPATGATISAGFEFDIPVRFDMDEITINLKNFEAGDIPSIPLMELLA